MTNCKHKRITLTGGESFNGEDFYPTYKLLCMDCIYSEEFDNEIDLENRAKEISYE